jgi:cellulose synthase operon protein C
VRAFRHALARYYLLKKRGADAEKEYRAIAAANPTDTQAKLDVVRFLNTVRGHEAAEAELRRLIEAEPQSYDFRFALAQLRTDAGDSAAAERIYREVIGEAGTAEAGLKARNLLAALELRAGDSAAAQELIRQVLGADARNAGALVLRASLAMDRRDLDDAIADLRTILRDEPASSRALLLLAKAHALAGSVELADDFYLRAFQAAKGQPAVGMDYVRFLMKRNRLPRAEEVLTDMLGVAPNNPEVLKALAKVRLGRQDWIGAEEAAQAIAKIGDKERLADQIMGVSYAGQKRLDESIDAFKRAQRASPTAQRPMVALARAFVRAGKADEAEQFLNAVLASNADNTFARLTLGQVYVVEGKTAQAEQAFRETVRRKPDLVSGYRNLAALYAREKRLDEALQSIDEGLKAVPGDFALRLNRAGLFELRREWEAAIAEYEALYEERPNSDVVANNLAAVLTDHRTDAESKKRALALAERFRRSDIPYFQDTLGWVYYQLGDTEQAGGLIRDAAKRAPKVPVFQYHLGMVYLAEKQQDKAKEALQRALELSADNPLPEDEHICQVLQELREKPAHPLEAAPGQPTEDAPRSPAPFGAHKETESADKHRDDSP